MSSLRVIAAEYEAPARVLSGPGDLAGVEPGATLLVAGEPADGREAALWAGPLGLAVLNLGLEVIRG